MVLFGWDTKGARLKSVFAWAAATKGNRWAHRDGTMILMAHRHGFRAAELVDLRWDQIDFEQATLAVRRVKKGSPATTHPHPWRRVAAAEAAAARARAKITLDPRGNPLAEMGPRSPSGDSGFAYCPTGYRGAGVPKGHQWTPQSHLEA